MFLKRLKDTVVRIFLKFLNYQNKLVSKLNKKQNKKPNDHKH